MTSPKALEAWFTLMSEAMQGTKEAQEALKSLSEMSTSPEKMERWMARFMPGVSAATPVQAEAFEEWLEEWWRMMGVVPRSRYLELLEKYDLLQRRLKKAEETIQSLRETLGSKGQEDEAKKVLDLWSTMLQDTLKTQTEWMQAWTEANRPPDKTGDEDQAGSSQADEPETSSEP